MHLVSAFPGALPHTHIVCRAIMHLAGELIQQYNVFQTKCTLFPPGQLNRNKSVQKHWPEAKHFASWKDVWWLPLWTTSALPGAVGWAAHPCCLATASLLRQIAVGSEAPVMVFSMQYISVQPAWMKPLLEQVVSMLSRGCSCSHRANAMEWCWACFLQAVLSLENLNLKLLSTGDVCQSLFLVPDLWAGGLYLAEKQGHDESCFRANKSMMGRGLAAVTGIGRRRPCSQVCDLSSFQSFLWRGLGQSSHSSCVSPPGTSAGSCCWRVQRSSPSTSV